MELHFDDIFHTMYRNCGWDIKTSLRGRPILLSDFWDAVEEVCSDFKYGEEVKRNFYGALHGRVSSMLRNSALVGMYNTSEGITWIELVEGNNIIDMEGLHPDDQKFLVGIISAGIHMYKMGNPSNRLTNLLVIEEASYLLKKPRQADIYGDDVSMIAIEGVMDMLTTAGGNGLGIILIEQLPGRLYENAVKIIVNTISHAVAHTSERTLVAGHLGIKGDKADHLLGMRKGEVIVRFEGMTSPTNVQIAPLDRHLDQSLPVDLVKEDMIYKVMEPKFKAHPKWGQNIDLPEDIIARLEHAKPEEVQKPTPAPSHVLSHDINQNNESVFEDALNEMDNIIGLLQYKNEYVFRAEEADSGNTVPLITMMVNVGDRLCPKDAEPGPFCEKLFTFSQKRYNVPCESVATNIVLTLRGEVAG
jgi:hypothetical protein